ncbi:MAG: hypothetical protein M1839_004225 [Geoglossum umbratile]|nr:MAG: hypothetical protein M1839_004225 [Geoglossum umbratile]
MGFPPPSFAGHAPPWVQQSGSVAQSMTVVQTVAGPAQTVTDSGELHETTKYITYATTYLVNPSASAIPTNTDAPLPIRQGAPGLHGARLAAAVCFPIASVFVLCLLGFFLLKRRRQKKRAKEMPGEMASVAVLSPQPPSPKPSDCPPEDGPLHHSALGLPPIDIEQSSPVAFPGEIPQNGPERQPFSYAGYFSGIDTSAAESQHTPVNGLSYQPMSPDPPPPYVPPLSPSNSVCIAHPRPISTYQLSQAGMPSHGRREIISPFTDPADGDSESEAASVDRNEVIRRRGTDDVSVASNISNRDRETLVHQMV